jgi:dTDP-4-amino-4,6-dideoxygalactose transaminase
VIRLAAPDIDAADIAAVTEVLKTGYLVQGAHVREFEDHMAREVGVAHGVAVANCTAALHLALLALNIGPGDRVAVPAFSWLATANVVVLCGAEPVFVDIEPCGYGMDPAALATVLADPASFAAIMPVHALGAMADIRAITELAADYGIPVIEDAACALGARQGDRAAGAWGDVGCFSFHPRKAVTTGEGGMLTTNDAGFARQLRILRNHGLDPDSSSPNFIAAGFNLRLTEFQAALGVTQLAKLDALVERRRALARRYTELFAGSPIAAPREPAGTRHVYQSYAVLLPPGAAARRTQVIAALRERGIETTIGTHHMPLTTFFRARGGYAPGDFPVTDDVAGRALSLPLHSRLTDDDQMQVASALLAVL